MLVLTGRLYSRSTPAVLNSLMLLLEVCSLFVFLIQSTRGTTNIYQGLCSLDPFIETVEEVERVDDTISVIYMRSKSVCHYEKKDDICLLRMHRYEPGEVSYYLLTQPIYLTHDPECC